MNSEKVPGKLYNLGLEMIRDGLKGKGIAATIEAMGTEEEAVRIKLDNDAQVVVYPESGDFYSVHKEDSSRAALCGYAVMNQLALVAYPYMVPMVKAVIDAHNEQENARKVSDEINAEKRV
jgi:hypothetical protein